MAEPAARRLPPARRRLQLTETAVALFAAHAEDEVGIEDVAAAAGVTRNLLYHYFGSKPELYRAAVQHAIVQLAELMDTDQERSLGEKLPANIGRWLDAVERDHPALRLLLRAEHSSDPEARAIVAAAREALARSIALNHLHDADPPAAVVATLLGYLALAERLNAAWLDERVLERRDVERILGRVLPELVDAAAEEQA